MKKLIKLVVILVIALGIFRMVDEENYMRAKPLIKSLRIYNERDTDNYYLVYDFNEYINNLAGSRLYLHGNPVKSEVGLLPKHRQKHTFDNWDFTLNKLEDNTFVRTINSRAKNFTSIRFGIYRLPDGTVLPGVDRRVASIKNIDLSKAKVIEKLDLNNLKDTRLTYNKRDLRSFGYHKNLEIAPVNRGIIFTALLAMAVLILGYTEKLIKEEYNSKKDIPKVLTFIIIGIYPIFIFIKSGALSTIVDILLGLLVIRLLIGERIEKKNIRVYTVLILVLAWWYYTTKTGIDAEAGMKTYEGMIKYLSLPILLSLTSIDWDKIKRISGIYLLACISYLGYFIDKLNLVRFGSGIYEGQRLAQILSFVIMGSLVFLIYGRVKRRYKVIFAGVILSALPFVMGAGVRGVWVGLFPLMTLITAFKYRKSSVVLLVAGVLCIYSVTDKNSYMVNRIGSITDTEDDTSNRQRVKMWEFALEGVAEKPLKGIGLGGYSKRTSTSQKLIDKRDVLEIKLKDKNEKGNKLKLERDLSDVNFLLRGPEHSHNSYLETLVATGVPGLLLYVVLIILIFMRLFEKFIDLKGKNESLIFISFTSVFICDMVYNMTDYGFGMSKPQQSLWFAIALLLNYKGKRDNEEDTVETF